MRVKHLETEEFPRRNESHKESFGTRLSLITSESSKQLTELSGFFSHLLTGIQRPWLTEAGLFPGTLFVEGNNRQIFHLRRRIDSQGPRLTISQDSLATGQQPSEGINLWHHGVEAEVLDSIYFDSQDDPSALGELLSPRLAAAFNRLINQDRQEVVPYTTVDSYKETHLATDRDLLSRRDELVERIESVLAERREESHRLEQQLAEIDQIESEMVAEIQRVKQELASVTAQLGEEESRNRYAQLNQIAFEAEGLKAAEDWEPRVRDLDAQIERWRDTLSELEIRLARVRGELAQVHPDDSTPELPLADQRASITVAQRLLVDLESEIARFARPSDSPLCICQDAHARLNPLVETLSHHVTRLSDLVAQQDRALRTQELVDESERIERSQTEIRCQLEKLLDRRQTLWRTSRARVEQPIADETLSVDTGPLQARHDELQGILDAKQKSLQTLRQERDALLQQRTEVLKQSDLRAWRLELETLQAHIASGTTARSKSEHGPSLRASDILAKLSDGELTQLRLISGGREVLILDRHGLEISQDTLHAEHGRLVVWALRLALADACSEAGVSLPIILDEPFRNLGDRHTANLVTALDDLHARGRQVFILSQNQHAINRAQSLGGSIHYLDRNPVIEKVVEKTIQPRKEAVTETIVETLPVLSIQDSISEFPITFVGRDDAFKRARIRFISDLLEADPSAVSEEMDVELVTAELVSLWQAHLCLVCFVNGLTFEQAKQLTDIGIFSVDELADADLQWLIDQFRSRGLKSYGREKYSELIRLARKGTKRWRKSTSYSAWSRNRAERGERIRGNTQRRSGSTRKATRKSRSTKLGSRSNDKPLRFFLEASSPVIDAPSIGTKRAEMLNGCSIVTVTDLLSADPQILAIQLDHSKIDSSVIVAWQHQANLVCRIPELRGHDAQVLVGSGFTTPEEISGMKPAELLEFVDPFCDSSEGQRALRGSKRPDLQEVKGWIENARQCRSLNVA